MINEKLRILRHLKRELKTEEKLLDFYSRNTAPDKVTYAMSFADVVNRQAYEQKKQTIRQLEEEIAKEGEVVNLHFTIPGLPAGCMPLSAFTKFTENLAETLRLIGNDIICSMNKDSQANGRRKRKYYTPDLQLFALTPGSFNVQLGSLNDSDSLFYGSGEERKVNVLYKSGIRLLHIMDSLHKKEDPARQLAEESDEILESIKSIYETMDTANLSLDISWNYHPIYDTFSISHEETAPIAKAIEAYVEHRQDTATEQLFTGIITGVDVKKYIIRLQKKDGTPLPIKFRKEDLPALMAQDVNPLYPKEYRIQVRCETKPMKKCTWQFKGFEEN